MRLAGARGRCDQWENRTERRFMGRKCHARAVENRAFALSDDDRAVIEMARGFADEKLAPHALEWDEKKHFPVDVLRETAALAWAPAM